VYGEDMQEDRMPYSEAVYDEAGADATFKVYDGVGHTAAPLQIQQDIASFHRRAGELKQLSFTERPKIGDTTVQFDTFVFDDREYQLRVRSTERGDITGTPAPVTANEGDTSTVDLSSAVENEGIVGVVVPAGTTDSDTAVASVRREVQQLPLLRIVDPPTGSLPSITVEYGVSGSYRTSSPIHLYVEDSSGGRTMLTTFEPGTTETAAFDLSRDELDVAVDEGAELSVELIDVDDGSVVASTSTVVGDSEGNEETTPDTGSVTFSTQPTDARDSLDITYSIQDSYEPDSALTLRGEIGEDTRVLLGAPAVGEEITETFSVEKVPMVAGTDIAVRAVDEQVIDADRTVVFRDTEGAVTVGYTKPPTATDRSATVEYSVSETYEVADALTLRVYDGTLYGTDPGDAIALLSPGDTGTVTFTIGEDTDTDVDEPVVAVVDDVPIARATTHDSADEPESGEETDDERTDESESSGGTDEESRTSENEQSDGVPETEDERDDETTGTDGPGFGLGTTVLSAGGLSYLLKRRFDDD
jgi:hypothetical protein